MEENLNTSNCDSFRFNLDRLKNQISNEIRTTLLNTFRKTTVRGLSIINKMLKVFSGKINQIDKLSKEAAMFRPMSPAELRIDFGPSKKTKDINKKLDPLFNLLGIKSPRDAKSRRMLIKRLKKKRGKSDMNNYRHVKSRVMESLMKSSEDAQNITFAIPKLPLQTPIFDCINGDKGSSPLVPIRTPSTENRIFSIENL
ncbi:unnamed protein product [Moneuplotes crassus]|uniref:Uncharacterized protein n=1 Tax=Euplotes crassus TaxID=5936 RepID=A0AAD1X2S0_EUPCR|nr:unnamed protein product [Moneuplotes crassus]